MRTAGHLAIVAHELPAFAGVVAAEQPPRVDVRKIRPGHAVARLDERVDALRVGSAHREADFAEWLCRQAVRAETLPGRAGISRFPDAAPRAAARAAPGVNLDLPHAGVEDARVARVHHEIRRADGIIDEQHAVPRPAAVGRAIDAALRLRSIRVTQRRDVDDVGIRGVHDDASDPARVLETGAGPGLSRVRRFEHAPADGNVAADEGLAGSGPDDIRIGRRDGKRTDGRHRLRIEDWIPVNAAVARLPQSARRRAGVVDVRVAGNAGYRRHAIPLRADVSVAQPRVDERVDAGLRGRRF